MNKTGNHTMWAALFAVLIVLFLGTYLTGVALRMLASGFITLSLKCSLDSPVCLLLRYSQTAPMLLLLFANLARKRMQLAKKESQRGASWLQVDWAPSREAEAALQRSERGKILLLLTLALLAAIAVA